MSTLQMLERSACGVLLMQAARLLEVIRLNGCIISRASPEVNGKSIASILRGPDKWSDVFGVRCPPVTGSPEAASTLRANSAKTFLLCRERKLSLALSPKDRPMTQHESTQYSFSLLPLGMTVGVLVGLILECFKVSCGERAVQGYPFPNMGDLRPISSQPLLLEVGFWGLLIGIVFPGPVGVGISEDRKQRRVLGSAVGALTGFATWMMHEETYTCVLLGEPIGTVGTVGAIPAGSGAGGWCGGFSKVYWRIVSDGLDPFILMIGGGLLGVALTLILSPAFAWFNKHEA